MDGDVKPQLNVGLCLNSKMEDGFSFKSWEIKALKYVYIQCFQRLEPLLRLPPPSVPKKVGNVTKVCSSFLHSVDFGR